MPDFRKDPIVGRWVIVAEGRSQRPDDFERAVTVRTATFCPFCEGHEDSSPAEVAAYRAAGTEANRPGWRVRVVPNKYPALEQTGPAMVSSGELYESLPGWGVHEVIVESPRHLTSTSQLSVENLAEVLAMYRDRLLAMEPDRRLRYGMIFKNVGATAGASLEHSHSQLIVMPIVPINVVEEMSGSLDYHRRRGRCVYCQLIADELADGRRVVLERPNFLAFCPFAARFPLETWILPKTHHSHYEQLAPERMLELAEILRQVVARIESACEYPAYNYIIHTAPFDTPALDHYHWHIEVIPRLTNMAGFEWGTGFHINPVSPEEAARSLRTAEERLAMPAGWRCGESIGRTEKI